MPRRNCDFRRVGPELLNGVWRRISWLAGLLLLLSVVCPSAAIAQSDTDAGALFKSKCAVCHGADGSGDTGVGKSLKLRDLRSAEVQKQSDVQLSTITSCGKRKMPAYESRLSEEQIHGLVTYLRELGKQK